MNSNQNSIFRQIALGVLLAALLLSVPARAQWTVFDPANYKVQIKRQIEELNRWLDTVNQYTRLYENAVGQLTHLQGILRTTDELMARDKRMRTFISYWGQVIRLTFRVTNQLVNLVTGNLRAIANMERRLRNGIFDPEADRRDFEEYLRYSIGRIAQDTEPELERLKRMDNQFERLEHAHQIAADNATQLQTYLSAKKEELERLKNCDDCTEKDRDIERLSFEIAKLEEKTAQAQAETARIFDQKAKRAEAIYQVGNLALKIIKPESRIFTLATDGSITGDPNMVGPATAACVVLIVLMIVGALLLLASPYISYKIAFGQIFEAVSSTAAGWMGALTATGIEIAGITYGSALQRQASETRIEGQAQAEIARAMALKDASDLQSRAHQILGLHSAAASRDQALGAIAGSYAMALRMNEAQRQATTGLIDRSRDQQVIGILADRSFGQRQAGIQVSREERDLRIGQAQQNMGTAFHRGLDIPDHFAGGLSRCCCSMVVASRPSPRRAAPTNRYCPERGGYAGLSLRSTSHPLPLACLARNTTGSARLGCATNVCRRDKS